MGKMNGNEDDMDLESLQAQIDMSISFAQDLVSSWMESSKVSATSRSHDLEKELKEYMRRPPRLGVGTPIPESNSLSKAGVRLKGQLQDRSKRKRKHEEQEEEERNGSDSPDESKASVIKKKAALDPLVAVSRSSKKSKVKRAASRDKRRTNFADPSCDETEKSVLVGPVNPAVSPSRTEISSTAIPDTALESSTSEVRGSVTIAKIAVPSDKASEAVLSHSRLPFVSPRKTAVLNLDGPPPSDGENAADMEGQIRKKKRRKRKKKKKQHVELRD
jgi:hypothetical protein